MAYTTINKSTDHFNTKLYTGNNSTNAITGVGFQPDFTWLKPRNSADNHRLMDAVNSGKYLVSNDNRVEASTGSNFASFDTDGFTLGGSDTGWNGSSVNYVSWNWKANGAGSANTDGTINSTVSVNSTAGFSIVKWTGNETANSVGHGLGVVPSLIIVKSLASQDAWYVYHKKLGATKSVFLNLTNAESTSSTYWNNTAPTNSVFYIAGNTGTNNTGGMIAYCFAEKTGYSKFGSYTGNGSTDGPMIFLGFKPALFIMKETTDSSTNWIIYDNKRSTFNAVDDFLKPNSSDAESTGLDFDFLSNGVRCRTNNGGINGSGNNYIYLAFAEAPLIGTNNVPCTAR